ncbi:Ankyrin repeat/KH domain protein [Hirschfeldia incana]|nr:Ankyrin repeat/KH domain protein [Hirschfeldia incana]
MKLVWSPETASKAYLDTVKSCENLETHDAAELISAMAAGWNAKLIVETWSYSYGDAVASSIGLNVASQHTNAKHICIVQNSRTESAYLQAIQEYPSPLNLPETIISQEPGDAMKELQGIDFLVVDWRHKEFAAAALRNAAFGSRGAVVVCRNGYSRSSSGFSWRRALRDREVVRTVTLPVTGGIEIAHVAAMDSGKSDKSKRRWITHIDQRSGEEHVFSV